MGESRRRRLFVQDKRIVSVDEAKREAQAAVDGPYDAEGKRVRPPGDYMQDAVTRQEMVDHLAQVALVMAEKMYNQFGEETQQFLQEMEEALRHEIYEEFERRTIRGRVKAWWHWLTRQSALSGWLMELGLVDPVPDGPRLVEDAAVAALDPAVTGQPEGFPFKESAPITRDGVVEEVRNG